jgi:hypothetical protein
MIVCAAKMRCAAACLKSLKPHCVSLIFMPRIGRIMARRVLLIVRRISERCASSAPPAARDPTTTS